MKIYEFLQIGEFHTNHCEDYLITSKLGKDKFLFAVMDGSSGGFDSHIPSSITGKLLRKISKMISYLEFYEKSDKSLSVLLKEILRELFNELKTIKNQLQLNEMEFCNTLNLLLFDSTTNTGESFVIGDGAVYYNGKIIDYDQNHLPDYIAYHLYEDFDEWFTKQKQRITISRIDDISISTDGIFSFKQFSKEIKEIPSIDQIINFLLKDKEETDNENLLKKNIIKLQKEYNLKPTDDLAIIRIINKNN